MGGRKPEEERGYAIPSSSSWGRPSILGKQGHYRSQRDPFFWKKDCSSGLPKDFLVTLHKDR
jgi:hypothetical protein